MARKSRVQRLKRSLLQERYPALVYPPLLLKLKVREPLIRSKLEWQTVAKKELTVPKNTFTYFLPLYGALAIAIWLRWLGSIGAIAALLLLALAIASYYFRLPVEVKAIRRVEMNRTNHYKSIEQRLSGKVLTPSGSSNAPSGASEARFRTYLERHFNVTQNLRFDIPNTELSYTPDFLIVDETGITIDVEIDEPYEYKSKKPHHCVDEKQDHLRDAFFRDRTRQARSFQSSKLPCLNRRC